MNETNQLTKLNEQIEQIEQKIGDPNLCKASATISNRISGYYRAGAQSSNPNDITWNTGKCAEWKERTPYKFS
jgi:hypothetical protein